MPAVGSYGTTSAGRGARPVSPAGWRRPCSRTPTRPTTPMIPATGGTTPCASSPCTARRGWSSRSSSWAGSTAHPAAGARGVQVAFGPDGDPILRLRQGLQQQGFDDSRAIDEQMDEHERIRLLYVACTRARDHLVVSLHRVDDSRRTGAHLLAGCVTAPEDLAALAGIQAETEVGATPPQPRHTAPAAPVPVPQVADLAAWRRSRAALVAAARVPGSVAATSLAARARAGERGRRPLRGGRRGPSRGGRRVAEGPDATPTTGATPTTEATDAVEDAEPGLAKRAVDLDLPAWRKGRYGTAIGRAVHAVLQVVDLATGEGLAALARAQATAEGIEGEHERIAALARSALDAPCVIEAAGSRHWREVYVGVPIGDTVLEGYVDLLYRRAGRPRRRGPQDGPGDDGRAAGGEVGRVPPPARGLRAARSNGQRGPR